MTITKTPIRVATIVTTLAMIVGGIGFAVPQAHAHISNHSGSPSALVWIPGDR